MSDERLREAIRFAHITDSDGDYLRSVVRRVADSPRIWWCNADRSEWPEDDEFGEYCAHDSERGCGFHYLVPAGGKE